MLDNSKKNLQKDKINKKWRQEIFPMTLSQTIELLWIKKKKSKNILYINLLIGRTCKCTICAIDEACRVTLIKHWKIVTQRVESNFLGHIFINIIIYNTYRAHKYENVFNEVTAMIFDHFVISDHHDLDEILPRKCAPWSPAREHVRRISAIIAVPFPHLFFIFKVFLFLVLVIFILSIFFIPGTMNPLIN